MQYPPYPSSSRLPPPSFLTPCPSPYNMSRIPETFKQLQAQKKKALIPFVTAGDPTPAMTVPIMHALVAAGADILELGVPFSDPTAHGPTIQHSPHRPLHHGVGLKDVL